MARIKKHRKVSRQEKSSQKNRGWLVISAIVVIASISGFVIWKNWEKKESVPVTPASFLTNKSVSPVPPNSWQKFETLEEALFFLIKDHPKKEVNTDLYEMIASKEILIQKSSLSQMPGGSASFILSSKPGGGYQKIFLITEMINDPQEHILFKQMVVYHEFLHVQQLIQGEMDPEDVMVNNTTHFFTEKKAGRFWKNELAAYIKSCEFLVEYQAEAITDICISYKLGGEKALKDYLLKLYCNDPLAEVAQHCELFKELAKQ